MDITTQNQQSSSTIQTHEPIVEGTVVDLGASVGGTAPAPVVTPTPAPTPAPEQSALGQQTQAPEWISQMSQEFRDHPTIKNFTNIDEFAKSYLHAQSLVGADKFVVPGQNAAPEEWDTVYGKLGRPEKSEGYQLELPQGSDEALVTGFKGWAHEAGLNNKQAQVLVTKWNEFNGQQMGSIDTKYKEQLVQEGLQLKTEWGQAYDQNIKQGLAAVESMPEELKVPFREFMNTSGVGDKALMLKAFAHFGRGLVEKMVQGTGEGGAFGYTPEAAQAEIDKIMADKKGPYYDKYNNAGRQEVIKHLQSLYKIVTPEQQKL